MRVWVWDFGMRVWIQGFGSRDEGLDLGFRVSG